MPDYIGNIEVPEIVPSGVFPIVPDYGYGHSLQPQIAVHQFGSANAKIEQRFLLGTGARRFTVRRSQMREADRAAIRNFWEARYGPYGAFTYNAPNDNGVGTTAYTCRFANEPLSWEFLSDAISSVGITLIEIPSSSPSYTLNQTVTRFPPQALKDALLSQVQDIIPLVKIQVRESGYPAIYVSDRRCTVGAQLYLARLLEFQGISQAMGNESDEAQFTFGNADRVMRDLANDTDLFRASLEFSLFHVGTGIKLDLWKGEVLNWQFDAGPEFRVTAADGMYELNLPYPTRKVSRTCWKCYNDANSCPYATQGSMDYVHFPNADPSKCDKGYETDNGCLAHGMKHYFGGILAEPQGVTVKEQHGFQKYIRRITSVSLVADSIYDEVIPEIYTDANMPVNCKIAAGREEDEFYDALGIVGEGPITLAPSGHTLDGQFQHGYPTLAGIRWAYGYDPALAGDFFSLGELGDTTGGDWRKVFYGGSTYRDNFAAGTAFLELRRKDEKGIQLTRLTGHAMQAIVQTGLQGWIWTAPGTRAQQTLTNPVWIAVNMLLRARGLRFADAATAEQYFDVDAAIAAASICNERVAVFVGFASGECTIWTDDESGEHRFTIDGQTIYPVHRWLRIDDVDYYVVSATSTYGVLATSPGDGEYSFTVWETQFKFRGLLEEEKPLRDWIQEILMNCLGYYSFCFGKLRIGVRVNSSVVEAFTEGNILFQSLQLAPLKPSFNHLTANFADEDFDFVGNSVTLYDIDYAKLIGGATAPLFLKSNVNLSGSSSKSQAARIITTRLREELGGITAEQWKAARQLSYRTTVLALNTEPGMVCSMTHPDMPNGAGEFRIAGWKLNNDYSIDVQGRTTVDEMYDLVSGPKPADVPASPVPPEPPPGTHVPDDLYANAIPNGLKITFGFEAWKWNAGITEGEFRAKRFAPGSDYDSVDLRTPAEGGTLVHDGVDEFVVTGLTATEQGFQYIINSASQGVWYYAGRLKNGQGWSVWSDGNDTPQFVEHHVETETASDTGPPDGWSIAQPTEGPFPGTALVAASRPTTNGHRILFFCVQIKDATTGAWRAIDANAGAAATIYDGSAISHIYNKAEGTITKASGNYGSAAEGDLILFDVRGGAFNRQYCQWATIPANSISGSTISNLIGFRPAFDPTDGEYADIRIKIVKPLNKWNTEGYFGDEPNHGCWFKEYYSGGQQGDLTTQLFVSDPIQLPAGVDIEDVQARVWFENMYSRSDDDLYSGFGTAGGGSEGEGCVVLNVVSGHVTTDVSLGKVFCVTSASNFTLDNPSGTPYCGQPILWKIIGVGVPTLGTKFRLMEGEVISKSSGRDLLAAIYDAADDKWDAFWKKGV